MTEKKTVNYWGCTVGIEGECPRPKARHPEGCGGCPYEVREVLTLPLVQGPPRVEVPKREKKPKTKEEERVQKESRKEWG